MGKTVAFLNLLDIQVQKYFHANPFHNRHIVLEPIRARLYFKLLAQTSPVVAYSKVGPFLQKYLALWLNIDLEFYSVLEAMILTHLQTVTDFVHEKTKAYVAKGIRCKVEETTELALAIIIRQIQAVQNSQCV